MSEGKLKNCHVEEGRSPDVNISAYCHPSFSLENVKGSSNYKIIKSGRSLDLAYQLTAMTIVALFSFSVHATCTPTPDCASIGYTETSCETISLKCPFDQTKLYCFPCDSSYQYTCSNSNEYGDGTSCKGKYKSCCNTDCIVGAIYYSDKTCSSCVDSNKTPIGVVVKDNELVMSQKRTDYISWSSIHSDTSLTNYDSLDDAINDFKGKNNTAIIVAEHSNDSIDNNAGIYCNSYSTIGTTAGDWYLPSAGELYNYVYKNYNTIKASYTTKLQWNDFNTYFWSSSEHSFSGAWVILSFDNIHNNDGKYYSYSVTCFMEI